MRKLGDVLRGTKIYERVRDSAPQLRATEAKPVLAPVQNESEPKPEPMSAGGRGFARLEKLLQEKPDVLTRSYVRTPVQELHEVFEALESGMGEAEERWAAIGRLPYAFQKPASFLPLRYVLRWKDLRGSSDWMQDLAFLELVYLVRALGYRRVPGKRPT